MAITQLNPSQASLAGSGISAASSVGAQLLAGIQQKRLLRNQYDEWFKRLSQVGATPAAIAQGLTGSGPSSTPGVSAGASIPDFGQTLNTARDVASNERLRESERGLNLLELSWRPKKYFADLKKTWSEVGKNWSQADLNKGLKTYYDELERDVRLKRPWQISEIQSGLRVQLARYDEIRQNIEESKARERNFEADTYKKWNEGYNESLRGFQLSFENWIRSCGWNPSDSTWSNIERIAITDPDGFKRLMDTFGQSLNILDTKAKSDLGEHYKRNIALAGGLYGLSNMIGKHKTARAMRFNSYASGIGTLIGSATKLAPFMQASPNPIGFY